VDEQRAIAGEPAACVLVQELLPLYVDNEVAPATRDWMEHHLAVCPACRAAQLDMTQDILDITAPIKSLPEPVPPVADDSGQAPPWPIMTWVTWTAFAGVAGLTALVVSLLWR